VKFIHAADVHLDSPMRGLEAYEGAPAAAMRGATRNALSGLVDTALAEEVDFALIAGDLYDGDWKDYNTGLFFHKQLSRLAQQGIKVFLISGNHDASSVIAKHLRLPGNTVALDTEAPQTVCLDDLGVAIHGQGFSTRHCERNLAASYPPALAGYLNVGMLHTSLDGHLGHQNYAPCSLQDLLDKGYDYWALGHVHTRAELARDPWIVYPGNLQGRSCREPGPKGAMVVTAQSRHIERVEFAELAPARWDVVDIDASGADTEDDILAHASDSIKASASAAGDRLLAVRINVCGGCRAHHSYAAAPDRMANEIRALAAEIASDQVWVEKVNIRTHPEIDIEQLASFDGPIRELVAAVAELETAQSTLSELDGDLQALARRLPAELAERGDIPRFDDPDELAAVARPVQDQLLPRLLGQSGG
jgi:DNA repair protein SbcD/Mre11